MSKVVIDASHGGCDPGFIYGNRKEKDDSLKLAFAVGDILKNNGVDVAYTRTDDTYLPQYDRVNIINGEGGDFMMSLHRVNLYPDTMAPSVRFYVSPQDDIAVQAANNIMNNLPHGSYTNYGIVQRTELPILNDINMPGLVMELGYTRPEMDEQQFNEELDMMANAIAKGILETLSQQKETTKYNVAATNDAASQNCPGCNLYIEETDNIDPDEASNENRRYKVQVGLFRVYDHAAALKARLHQEGFESEIVPRDDFYAVHVGNFVNMDDAAKLETALRRRGYNTLLVTVQ